MVPMTTIRTQPHVFPTLPRAEKTRYMKQSKRRRSASVTACTLLAVLAVLAVVPVMAESGSSSGHWETSARVSTLGAGVEVKRTLGSNLAARAMLNGFSLSLDEEYSDVDYDGDLKLKSGGLVLDFHPGGSWFRMSAGILLNGNRLDVDAEPTAGTFEFNDVTYSVAQVGSAKGEADFNSIAPYAGIGFSKSPGADGGLSISGDMGLVFQGSPSFDLDVTCGAVVPAVTCTRLQSDVDAERTAFEDDADEYKYFPVVSLGLGYRW